MEDYKPVRKKRFCGTDRISCQARRLIHCILGSWACDCNRLPSEYYNLSQSVRQPGNL